MRVNLGKMLLQHVNFKVEIEHYSIVYFDHITMFYH